MNILDFVLFTILAIALVRGFIRGAIRQVASLLGIIAGFVLAGHLYLGVLRLLRSHLPSVPHLAIFSYAAVFAATWLVTILLGAMVVRFSRAILMGWADRLLGGVLGMLKGAAVGVVLVAILTIFLPENSQVLTGSLLSAHLQRAGFYLVQLTPGKLRKRYQTKHDTLLRHLKRQQLSLETESVRR